jgi:hypothetical protein
MPTTGSGLTPCRLVCFLSLAALAGCGDDAGPNGRDGGPDARADSGADGSTECERDEQCDNGVFCDGEERCVAGGCEAGEGNPCAGDGTMDDRVCDEENDRCATQCEVDPDADGDGVDAEECGGTDCDDGDPDRFPGNAEVCDDANHDEDCSELTFGSRDLDSDGFVADSCCNETTAGDLLCGQDCNDGRRNIKPDVSEVCDGLDNDCDGAIDEGVTIEVWPDLDGDGFGAPAMSAPTDGGVGDGGPMDASADGGSAAPADASVGDGGAGSNGSVQGCPGLAGFANNPDDCDDSNPEIHPALPEACEPVGMEVDNNCDGDLTASGDIPWYADDDGDAFGDIGTVVMSCARPTEGSWVLNPLDCDDDDPMIRPNAPELCDGVDNNCNGVPDFQIAPGDFEDDDRDGVGDAACGGDDCDDLDSTTFEGAQELCDDRDNDCDTAIDEDTMILDWYVDSDGDGFGDEDGSPVRSCPAVSGRVPNDRDCDDADEDIRPGADELCNGIDDDCNGAFEGPGEDVDEDGYFSVACGGDVPGADCDDSDADIFPGAPERCNGIDDDCNGVVEEDQDGDGSMVAEGPLTCIGDDGTLDRLDCDDTQFGYKIGDWAHCGSCDSACGVRESCDGSGGCYDSRRVFVSSARRNGAFGGLTQADTICQTLADANDLGGTWVAWLADSATSVASRMSQASVPYVRLDGVRVADNWSDLVDQSVDARVDVTEQRARYSGRVWTGSRSAAVTEPQSRTCNDWTYDQNDGSCCDPGDVFGRAGLSYRDDSWWDGVFIYGCQGAYPFYCVEQ